MPGKIQDQLSALGVARVIVILRAAGAAASTDATAIRECFTTSKLSPSSQLAAAIPRAKTPPPLIHYPNLGVVLGTIDDTGLKRLRADKEHVASVGAAPQLSIIRPTRVAAAKLTRAFTWGINALGVRKLWSEGFTGDGILIGHCDTGVDGSHVALKDAIAKYAVFDDLGRQLRTPPKPPADTGQHGTHTAGTIAGRPVSGKYIGVAPAAKLASATVIESGDVAARVLGGLDWCVSLGVRVVSMSLGIRGVGEEWHPITQILRAKNILPVFAAGNEGPGTSRYPGNYPEALSVGAIDANDDVPDFSSSQRFARQNNPVVPDVVGPGVGVISAKPGGGYQQMDGTSMATPHIAGLAALLFQARPNATANDVEAAILKSCKLLSGMTPERAGSGLPNAALALAALPG
jgi:subtilisin